MVLAAKKNNTPEKSAAGKLEFHARFADKYISFFNIFARETKKTEYIERIVYHSEKSVQKTLPNNASFDLAMKIYANKNHPSEQPGYNAMLKSLCALKK